MNNTLTIIHQKGLCSIQDLGRDSTQHLGFSGGGVSDEFSFLTANQLLNNPHNAPALEITLGQISLQCHCSCTIAITGANCNAALNDKMIQPWAIYQLQKGDILTLKQPKQGLHSYLAFSGGIHAKTFANSCAQTLNEQALGLFEAKLGQNSEIHLSSDCSLSAEEFSLQQQQNTFLIRQQSPNFHCSNSLTLRFMPSVLWQQLSLKKQTFFLQQSYEILPQSNRMGYRLSSDVLFCAAQENMASSSNALSKAVTFGTIQLPPNGQPIVLMKERQTIGGYPVLGTVMKTDLFRLSQKKPGEHIRFTLTTVEQAQQQLGAFYQKFKR